MQILPQYLPGAGDVPLRGLQVADSQAQRVATAQHGVRQEDLARLVDSLDQALIEGVQISLWQCPGLFLVLYSGHRKKILLSKL